MSDLFFTLKNFGSISLDIFWFPLGVWTLCCALTFLMLRYWDRMNPLFHYHLRVAAVLSLPLGIAVAALMGKLPDWFSGSNIETAFFVLRNPIEIVVSSGASTNETAGFNWMEPSLWIGAGTIMLLLVSVFMLGRLVSSYVQLKLLYKNLNILDMQEVSVAESHPAGPIKVAFHDHPLVPFTFGWQQPVIVLPGILQHHPEKLEMALQHELIHIKRGDYLLQLALSMIESVFWFHPLIRYGNQEIDTYREISCDQEVLSKSEFSTKSYASLLYELVPLSGSAGRLSVSMAVHKSTLKKRIKTMKYHKLHKTSFRQSIAFLLLMIVGITLPIACSDLRGPSSLSMEELENATLMLEDEQVTINGIRVDDSRDTELETTGMGALIINAKEYGEFKIAPRKFDEGVQSGSIEGNKLSFTINEMDVEVRSSSGILSGAESSSIWVQHLPSRLDMYIAGTVSDAGQPLESSKKSLASKNKDDDHFKVVEEMPKLIGGMRALQSKIEYPEAARKAGVEGRVVVQFIVNEKGEVEEPKVVRGIGGGADQEALSVVKEAKFEPGKQRGQPVRVQYAVAINFQLSEDADFTSSN